MSTYKTLDDCLFCKIVKGEIPSYKLYETDTVYAFLDIYPLSKGHALVIPKYHAEKLHELPDDQMADIVPIAKKIAVAQGLVDYNILQNNGKIAHQFIPHIHFHVIPKPSATDKEGLVVGWPMPAEPPHEAIKAWYEELKAKL